MKKTMSILSILLAALMVNPVVAQVVFSSSFENWDQGKPVDWKGSATNLAADSISQVTSGTQFGSNAVQLQNRANGHKRFSSNAVSVEEGIEYQFKFWVRGKGDIRVGLFDNDLGNNDFGYKYGTYQSIDDTNWVEVNQSVIADTTTSSAQFIFSLRNTKADKNHLQIDSVVISSAAVEPVRIFDIQHTASPDGNSPLMGQTVTTGGIVTAVKPNPNGGYYLQAGTGAWTGVFVYDPGRSSTVAIGDSITLTGMVEEYFSTTQLSQVSGFELVSSGNPVPAALVETTANIGTEQMEGVLVKAQNAEAVSAPNNFKVWQANDGSGVLLVDTLLYRYTPIVGHHYNITGVITYAFSTYRILPRSMNDVEDLEPNGIPGMQNQANWFIYPNPSRGEAQMNLNLDRPSQVRVRLLDAAGRMVAQKEYDLNAGQNLIQIGQFVPKAGFYQVQLEDGNAISTRALIVQ